MPHGFTKNNGVFIEWAKCPRCDEYAEGESEIEILFGYRTMANGSVIPQSHCRACRSEEANH